MNFLGAYREGQGYLPFFGPYETAHHYGACIEATEYHPEIRRILRENMRELTKNYWRPVSRVRFSEYKGHDYVRHGWVCKMLPASGMEAFSFHLGLSVDGFFKRLERKQPWRRLPLRLYRAIFWRFSLPLYRLQEFFHRRSHQI